MKKYKFAVFDLDGTLLDTLDDLTAAVNHALKKYNLPERTVTEVAAFLGNGAGKLIELSTPDGQNNPYFKDILAEFKKYYAENNSVSGSLKSPVNCSADYSTKRIKEKICQLKRSNFQKKLAGFNSK